jgi:hypothetical protein
MDRKVCLPLLLKMLSHLTKIIVPLRLRQTPAGPSSCGVADRASGNLQHRGVGGYNRPFPPKGGLYHENSVYYLPLHYTNILTIDLVDHAASS